MRILQLTCLLCLMLANIKQSNAASVPAESAPDPKDKPALLNSYLPAAMQVLAHLTNQMKAIPVAPAMMTTGSSSTHGAPAGSSTTSVPSTTAASTTETPSTTAAAVSSTTESSSSASSIPENMSTSPSTEKPANDLPSTISPETTPAHAPAIFAPPIPPSPLSIKTPLDLPAEEPFISPIVHDHVPEYPQPLYLPDQPQNDFIPPVIAVPNYPFFERAPQPYIDSSFPVISYQAQLQSYPDSYFHLPPVIPQNYDSGAYPAYFIQSRVNENSELPDISALPVQNEDNYKSNPLELEPDELSSENLQYLSPVVRELLQGIHGPVEPVEEDLKYGNPSASFQSIEDLYDDEADKQNIYSWLRLQKAAPSESFIRMLLLYDMLSRDAKSQKLNKYGGFSEDLVGDLNDISKISAADQLKTILDRMVARGDCKNDFANKRAMDMAKELEKEESKMAMELKNLKPLKYEKN